jgi:hypothetical protein
VRSDCDDAAAAETIAVEALQRMVQRPDAAGDTCLERRAGQAER